ncbi:MAG TPA: hypothetical protein VF065_10650, partial [Ilumatobacter sp.]
GRGNHRSDPVEVDIGVDSQSCHVPSLPHAGGERESSAGNPPCMVSGYRIAGVTSAVGRVRLETV